jgi:hypothetical protein
MVKISNPDSVFRGILEFWPLDVHWEGTTASIRRVPPGPLPMQNHVAFRVDRSKEEILEILTRKGITARYEPRGPGFLIVGFMILHYHGDAERNGCWAASAVENPQPREDISQRTSRVIQRAPRHEVRRILCMPGGVCFCVHSCCDPTLHWLRSLIA